MNAKGVMLIALGVRDSGGRHHLVDTDLKWVILRPINANIGTTCTASSTTTSRVTRNRPSTLVKVFILTLPLQCDETVQGRMSHEVRLMCNSRASTQP